MPRVILILHGVHADMLVLCAALPCQVYTHGLQYCSYSRSETYSLKHAQCEIQMYTTKLPACMSLNTCMGLTRVIHYFLPMHCIDIGSSNWPYSSSCHHIVHIQYPMVHLICNQPCDGRPDGLTPDGLTPDDWYQISLS